MRSPNRKYRVVFDLPPLSNLYSKEVFARSKTGAVQVIRKEMEGKEVGIRKVERSPAFKPVSA